MEGKSLFKTFNFWYLMSMLTLQVVTFFIAPMNDPTWVIAFSFSSAVLSVLAVVLAAQRNIRFYIFGFLQNAFYMAVVWNARLYLEFGEYIFYNITMIYGIYVWKNNLEDNSKTEVKAKRMTLKAWLWTIVATMLATIGFGLLDDKVLNGAVPYLDAFTISFTVIAQILMTLCYRDQWVFWFILDVASIVTFAKIGNWILVAQYIAWTVNCIYGWYNWSKGQKKEISTKGVERMMSAAVVG